ncbi:hypothetical protein SVAN01_05951 [Stagonosporopsis vannaccii]|nr:hypothetical protein SVAN01_05951 [Stagonosporopsis vannaccii]
MKTVKWKLCRSSVEALSQLVQEQRCSFWLTVSRLSGSAKTLSMFAARVAVIAGAAKGEADDIPRHGQKRQERASGERLPKISRGSRGRVASSRSLLHGNCGDGWHGATATEPTWAAALSMHCSSHTPVAILGLRGRLELRELFTASRSQLAALPPPALTVCCKRSAAWLLQWWSLATRPAAGQLTKWVCLLSLGACLVAVHWIYWVPLVSVKAKGGRAVYFWLASLALRSHQRPWAKAASGHAASEATQTHARNALEACSWREQRTSAVPVRQRQRQRIALRTAARRGSGAAVQNLAAASKRTGV